MCSSLLLAWQVQVQLWLLLTVGANKVEIILLCVRFINAVAFRVLPGVALFASNRMSAIIVVLTVLATHCTIEDPFVLLFGQRIQLFLSSLHLRLEVTLRQTAFSLIAIF